MKNYSIGKNQEKDYLLNFTLVQNGEESTYDVTFADGRVFGQVTANEENLAKFERIQEAQAEKGVANKHIFQSRRTKAGLATFGSAALSSAAGIGIANLISTLGVAEPNGLTLAIGVGVVTVLGSIPAFSKFLKNNAKVKELDKIEYRNEHKEQLAQIDQYANSLSGVSVSATALIEEEENPFSILNIDRFSLEDLEKIIDNMEREKRTGFQYTKGAK